MFERAATAGEVQTVLGPVDPAGLGATLIHEHLLLDVTCYMTVPIGARDRALANAPVSLETLSWVRRNWTSNFDNMRLDDRNLAIRELLEFKYAGGRTIVDVGNKGLARDAAGLREIALATGVQIVMGCGYYVELSHPSNMDEMSIDQIEEEIVRDIKVGVGPGLVKAGIIGELGCSWPVTPNEKKVLRAGARAQRKTGAALTIHTGRHRDSPLQIVEVLEDEGADLSRVVLDHLDREWPDFDKLHSLARRGCWLEFDTFGQETWTYPLAPMDRLTDWQRVEIIKKLTDDGFGDRILVSHDIGFKHRLMSFGGSGYAHILTSVVPLMLRKGLTEETITDLLVANPARILQLT